MNWNTFSCQMDSIEKFALAGGQTGPDGIAFDEEGNLFVAIYGSQHILVLDKSGTVTEKIQTSGQNPTNCALDPSGAIGLIITEAEKGQLLQLSHTKKGIL